MGAKLVKFIEATSTELDNTPLDDGTFFFTTDTKKLYRDTNSERVLISGGVNITFEDETETLKFE